jgi:hypothetical protein
MTAILYICRRIARTGCPMRFFARAADDMPKRVRVERAFTKMFRSGLRLCKTVPHFVDGEIPARSKPNIHDFGNATIYLTMDGRPILWPLGICMRNTLSLNQRLKG